MYARKSKITNVECLGNVLESYIFSELSDTWC